MSTPADSPAPAAPEGDGVVPDEAAEAPAPETGATGDPQEANAAQEQRQIPPGAPQAPLPGQYPQYPTPAYTRPYPPTGGRPRLPNPRWPAPAEGASPVVVWLAVAAALFAGWAAFQTDGVGIGLSLSGLAILGVAFYAGGTADLKSRVPSAILIAALWMVPAIRDAGWVVAVCVLAALLLTGLALTPQKRFTGTIVTIAFGYLEGLGDAFGWTRRAPRNGKSANTARNIRVIAITAALLVVFGGLFAAADRNFAELAAGLMPPLNPVEWFLRLLLAAFLFPLILLWAYTALVRPKFDPEEPPRPRAVSRMEVAVPLGALNALFIAFLAVQARAFFGGEEYVMETGGLTFAEYARSGFWQLVIVSILTIGVIAVAAWLAPRREKADRWTVRLLLGLLCAQSLVVVASAMLRMREYFETYGLTRLRMWVFTTEIWLAILFVLVLVCCWKLRATWLPRAALGSGVVVLLGLAAVNPDGFIARYNIDHEHELDLAYLQELSADAAPALMDLPQKDLECVVHSPIGGWDDSEPGERSAMSWNWGLQRASDLAEGVDEPDGQECPGTYYRDEYGAPELDSIETPDGTDSTDAGEAQPPAGPAGFFDAATCESLDTESADAMFGQDAKGNYGVEPDESRTWGTVSEAYDDSVSTGYLECAFYGTGTGYLLLTVDRYSEEFAKGFQNQEQSLDDSNGFDIKELNDFDTGYTAVYDTPTYKEYKFTVAEGELILRASIVDGSVGEDAFAVATDLLYQLHDRYAELS